MLRKELSEQKAVLQRRRTHKRGKRVKLEGQFVFSTADVLKIAREAEQETAAKRPKRRPRTRPIEEEEEDKEEEEVQRSSESSESEGSVIVVRTTRYRARQL